MRKGILRLVKDDAAFECCFALSAEAPLYFTKQFTRVSTITSGALRGSYLSLRTPRLKSRHGQNCFAYRESLVCSSLPSEIKSSRTFWSFQKKL